VAPTLAYSNLQTVTTSGTLTSTSFTPQTNDIIVVKAISADVGASSAFPAPTGGGWAYTQRVADNTASHVRAALWTAPVTTGGTAQTVSLVYTGTGIPANMVVELWRNAQLAATPATVDTRGSGAPSTTLTTAAANSFVSWANGDWAAVDGASRAYNTTSATPTEDGYYFLTSQDTVEFAYQPAAAAGSQTLGLTAPAGQTWTILGIEIQDAGAPAAGPPAWTPQRTRDRAAARRRRGLQALPAPPSGPPAAPAGITRVNTASVTGNNTGSPAVITIPAGTGIAAGDLIVVATNSVGVASPAVTVQDSVNAVNYTQLRQDQASSSANRYGTSFYYLTPQAIPDGSTITVTSAGATQAGGAADVFRGCSGVIDQAATGQANAATSTSCAAPALGGNATAGALVVTLACANSTVSSFTAGSPFTTGSHDTACCAALGYALSASGSSAYASTWTIGSSTSSGQTVSFAAGPPPSGIVQSAQGSSGTASLTITLGQPTGTGNTLIVLAAASGVTTNPTAIACTLGGVTGNFAQDGALFGSSSDAAVGAVWRDQPAASGQTTVGITATGGAGAIAVTASAWECSDLAASPLDKAASSVSAGAATWTSTATATTAQASERLFGGTFCSVSGSQPAVTGPASPWANLAQVNQAQGSFSDSWLAGSQDVAATGAYAYNGTVSPSSQSVTKVVTYKLAAGGGTQAGSASLSGTGTMSFGEIDQQVTAALSGAGTLSTAWVLAPGASLSGAGTLSAAEVQRVTAALAGTGTMTQAGTQIPGAQLSGTGALAAAVTQQPGAALAGTGALSTAWALQPAVSLSGTGTGTAGPPVVGILPSAALSGTGALAAAATQQPGAALSGSGSLLASVTWQPAVSLAGTGAPVTAAVQLPGAALAGSGALSAAPSWPQGALLGGSGTLTTAVTQGPSAALSGSGALSTAWALQPAVPLAGTGTLSTAAVQQATAALAGTGALTAGAVQQVTAALSGSGALAAAVTQQATAALSGTGALTTTIGGTVSGSASLSGTGTLSAAVTWQPGVSLSGSGALASAVSQGPGASLAGTGALGTSVTQLPGAQLAGTGALTAAWALQPAGALAGTGTLAAAVARQVTAGLAGTGALSTSTGGTVSGSAALSGTGSLSAAVTQGPGALLSGSGALSTSWAAQPGASLAGAGSLAAAVTTGPSAPLGGTGSLSAAAAQGPSALLAGTGSLGTAVTQGPGSQLGGAGTLVTAWALQPGALLAGSGSLAAAPGIVIRPGVSLAGTGSLTTTLGGTPVFDSDSCHAEDSGFSFLSDSDACAAAEAGQLAVRDSDRASAAENELSRWPSDSDKCAAAEAGGPSGPVADTPDSCTAADGHERIFLGDTEICAAADLAVVDVYTFVPAWEYGTWGGFRLVLDHPVLGEVVVAEAPAPTRALLELAHAVSTASTVRYITDADACRAGEAQVDAIALTASVEPAIQVTAELAIAPSLA